MSLATINHLGSTAIAAVHPEDVDHHPALIKLINDWLGESAYRHGFAAALADLASEGNQPWALRRLACLVLEHHILMLSPDDNDEWMWLLQRLQLINKKGHIYKTVLREGYTTRTPLPFARQLRERLARLDRVHRDIHGQDTTEEALHRFLFTATRDCKVTLARYFFSPKEIAAQIRSSLKLSTGIVSGQEGRHAFRAEMARTVKALPDYEGAIIKELNDGETIFWVGDTTSSEINQLVEYPLTAIVLVVKPPGSPLEFEIKRAGMRGPHLLSCLFERNGERIPPSHRFQGGSMGRLVVYEASASAQYCRIYRDVMGEQPSLSRTLGINSISTIPHNGETPNLLNYFLYENIYGEGYKEMRAQMAKVVPAFREDMDKEPSRMGGEVGLNLEFYNFTTPSQCFLSHTSAFRLDKLNAYLAPDGPDLYFKEGLGRDYTNEDARNFADELLEEILGVYIPPQTTYTNYADYVTAALAQEDNRRRADQNYLDIMQQAGRIWGVLMGVRGYTMGESFVGRNMGLKSVWKDGAWRVVLISMDHDDMFLHFRKAPYWKAETTVTGWWVDERYLLGGLTGRTQVVGSCGYFRNIYRISEALQLVGRDTIFEGIKEGYHKTRDLFKEDKKQRHFYPKFVDRFPDWDLLVGSFLPAVEKPDMITAWEEKADAFLEKKGYSDKWRGELIHTIKRFANFFERYPFLFPSDDADGLSLLD